MKWYGHPAIGTNIIIGSMASTIAENIGTIMTMIEKIS